MHKLRMKMKKNTKVLLSIAFLVSLSGCANQTLTGNAYSGDQARQTQTVQRGTVTEVRSIDISARSNGVGTLAGGALGGLAAS